LARQHDHVPSLALRALAHLGSGDAPAAEDDLTHAILLAPDHTRLFFMRSRVRQARQDVVGARRDFEEGLQRKPADELSWIARGIARLPTDPEGALNDFDAALAINPWSREAAQNKAHVLSERLSKPPEAIATLDPIVDRFPDYVIARIGRGVLLARLGRRDESRRDAAESLRRDPRGLIAYQAACIHALNARTHPADAAEAVALLHRALRDGFGSDLLTRDPDLAALQDDPGSGLVRTPPASGGAKIVAVGSWQFDSS
jgi:tetratricopeptide (TPR) repeat protein